MDKKEYDLQDESGVSLAAEESWELRMKPGALITMSILLKLSSAGRDIYSCPRCGTKNGQCPDKQGMILW